MWIMKHQSFDVLLKNIPKTQKVNMVFWWWLFVSRWTLWTLWNWPRSFPPFWPTRLLPLMWLPPAISIANCRSINGGTFATNFYCLILYSFFTVFCLTFFSSFLNFCEINLWETIVNYQSVFSFSKGFSSMRRQRRARLSETLGMWQPAQRSPLSTEFVVRKRKIHPKTLPSVRQRKTNKVNLSFCFQ